MVQCSISASEALFVNTAEFSGDRAGLEHEREVLRLADREDAGDLRSVVPRYPVRVVIEVHGRRRLDLAVEHDCELLVRGIVLRPAETHAPGGPPAAIDQRQGEGLEPPG